jgi:hypothetical protein
VIRRDYAVVRKLRFAKLAGRVPQVSIRRMGPSARAAYSVTMDGECPTCALLIEIGTLFHPSPTMMKPAQ